jgi:hypothetical protein
MRLPHELRRALAGETGFSLIEILVGMISGLVVMGALMGLLVVSQHQTVIVRDVGQATQSGRTAMTRIVDELHSSCIAKEFAPVLKESAPTKLLLVDAYSKEAEIKSGEKTREDVITFNKEKGTLTDETIASSGGEWPSFTFNGAVTKDLIGSNISETTESAKAVAIFTYYKYATEAEPDASPKPSSTLVEYEPPAKGFSEAEAATVSGVAVTFTAAPSNGLETVGRAADLNTLVTLSFSAPNSEAKVEDGPCR